MSQRVNGPTIIDGDQNVMTTFPSDFLWGASTSAYQVEGAALEDGKGPSVQDVKVIPAGTPDFSVCSDHYHRYKEDVSLFEELGLKAYRFSIAWTRIIPNGTGEVNPQGIEFYNNLIDELLSKNIEPVVTMYHFDLPQALQEKGGWANPETKEAFIDYARVLFREFGDRVKVWQTINEQNMMTIVPEHVVGGANEDYPLYQANHYMLVAQSAVMALCHEMLPDAKIGPAPSICYIYPLYGTAEDVQCAQYYNAIRNWLYLDAAVYGRYNTLALDWIRFMGYELEITEEDREILRNGHPDFIAFNYYNTETVTFDPEVTPIDENGAIRGPGKKVLNPNFPTTDWDWPIDAQGFRTTLQELESRYGLPLIVTENGLGAYDEIIEGEINDDYRIEYLRDHISTMRDAMNAGVQVFGYNPWAAIDLISTHEGFLKRYGFIFVNRDNESEKDLARIKKKSFGWYRKVIESNGEDLS